VSDIRREAEFADAALRLVVRDGLAGVSYRTVATEAGWSVGAVQKAFPTKRDLLEAVLRRAREAVPASVGAEPGRPTLRGWLVELLVGTLPLDDERRRVTLVGVAFSDRAPYDAGLADTLSTWDAETRGLLAALFARAVGEGELHPGIDHEQLARALLAFAAGLAAQLLYDPLPETDVRALVDRAVEALLTPPR
jgi:AcrR family transcriptional regulator